MPKQRGDFKLEMGGQAGLFDAATGPERPDYDLLYGSRLPRTMPVYE
jgi:hypothetical protein